MRKIKKMDHQQVEGKLQEAYEQGYRVGNRIAEIEKEYPGIHRESTEQQAAEPEKVKERDQIWQQAVEQTLEDTKGIGPARKELFLERLERYRERLENTARIE